LEEFDASDLYLAKWHGPEVIYPMIVMHGVFARVYIPDTLISTPNCKSKTWPPTPRIKEGAMLVPRFSKNPTISGTSYFFLPHHRLFKHFPTPLLFFFEVLESLTPLYRLEKYGQKIGNCHWFSEWLNHFIYQFPFKILML
jgi:hypothetical protein